MPSPDHRVATLVLCTRAGEVLGQLPPFRATLPWWQDATSLVEWVKDRHGVDVIILRLLEARNPEPPGGAVTYLAEAIEAQTRELPLTPWVGPLAQHPLRLPYAQPGGPGLDLAWAASTLESLGHRLGGPAAQERTWNLSSLWRLPLEHGAAWLKCVPPFFAHEGAILARLQGGAVPRLLAHEGGRLLMAEIPGQDQYEAPEPTLRALISILVDLQVQWASRVESLLSIGLPDWRAEALTQSIESVVRRTAAVVPNADRETLHRLVDALPRRFASVAECGIPDSLVHGDFAPGNARGGNGRLVLLDWGDSGVGHPLLDQSAFLDRVPSRLVRALSEHWSALWRQVAPGADPERAAHLLAPVSAARQAVIYRAFLDQIEPAEHPYHRSDPARWLSRAAELASRHARDAP